MRTIQQELRRQRRTYERRVNATFFLSDWPLLILVAYAAIMTYLFLFPEEHRLTELVIVKDGKDYRELYFGPEDCLDAGNDIEPGVYWRCETQ